MREIVPRLLKRFEQVGWVQLAHERISVLDGPALRLLADGGVPPSAGRPLAK